MSRPPAPQQHGAYVCIGRHKLLICPSAQHRLVLHRFRPTGIYHHSLSVGRSVGRYHVMAQWPAPVPLAPWYVGRHHPRSHRRPVLSGLPLFPWRRGTSQPCGRTVCPQPAGAIRPQRTGAGREAYVALIRDAPGRHAECMANHSKRNMAPRHGMAAFRAGAPWNPCRRRTRSVTRSSTVAACIAALRRAASPAVARQHLGLLARS